MHIIYCAQVCLCSDVVIDRLFSHSQYSSSHPAPNSAPQSHLHIGLPFGTPIPCLQLEQVLIRLGSFPPYVHVVSFTISVHEGTTKLFPVFLSLLYFSPFCLPFYFLPFPLRYFTPPSHLHIGCHSELLFVSADKAGRELGGFSSVIPASDFFRKFGPCRGVLVVVFILFVVSITLISFLTLSFLTHTVACLFLFHGIVPHLYPVPVAGCHSELPMRTRRCSR